MSIASSANVYYDYYFIYAERESYNNKDKERERKRVKSWQSVWNKCLKNYQ